MNSVAPRTLLAFLGPLLTAVILAIVNPEFLVPAFVVAAVSLGTVWIAGSGADPLAKSGSSLVEALRNLRTDGSVPNAPEELPEPLRRAWSELERIADRMQAQTTEVARADSLRKEVDSLRTQLDESRRNHQRSPSPASGGQVEELREQLQSTLTALEESLARQVELSRESGQYIRELATSISETGQQVELLATSAEDSSSAILEMTTTNDQMAHNIGELGSSVRESVASIEEMTFSIKEVAKNVDALSLTAEQTSSSMNQMDVSIDQVQSNANETARLSEEVARDAETGAEAILKTIGEIYRIKESSQEAVSVISNLGSRIDAIGQILNVIDEVAEQTNLLALNAAIIAAQAGEHGKGFAVVADEIKDLAERAGASTKEIADLIKTIQSESRNAIQAVERGAQNVDRGVQVSNDAERALKKILESSQKSTNMVRAIARATVEQAKGSKQVTDSIGRIAETVQQIAAATSEQARGSELIMTSGEKMRTIAQQVERSSQEQSRGGRQITQAIENISALVNQLNARFRQQSQESERALEIETRMANALSQQNAALRRVSEELGRPG